MSRGSTRRLGGQAASATASLSFLFFSSATSPDARSNFDLALRASTRPDTESNEQGTANGLELDVELALKQDEHVSDVEAVDDVLDLEAGDNSDDDDEGAAKGAGADPRHRAAGAGSRWWQST